MAPSVGQPMKALVLAGIRHSLPETASLNLMIGTLACSTCSILPLLMPLFLTLELSDCKASSTASTGSFARRAQGAALVYRTTLGIDLGNHAVKSRASGWLAAAVKLPMSGDNTRVRSQCGISNVRGRQLSKLQALHTRACITFNNCAFSSLFRLWTGLPASLQPITRWTFCLYWYSFACMCLPCCLTYN